MDDISAIKRDCSAEADQYYKLHRAENVAHKLQQVLSKASLLYQVGETAVGKRVPHCS